MNPTINIGMTGGGAIPTTLPWLQHTALALKRKHSQLRHVRWVIEPETLFDRYLGNPITYVQDEYDNETTLLTDYKNCLTFIHRDGRSLSVTLSARSPAHIISALTSIRTLYPEAPKRAVEPDEVPIAFWFHAPPPQNVRRIERQLFVPEWSDIRRNYPALQPTLDPMMAWTQPPEGRGKLIIWHSDPGTGKTFAIRALAREWRKWCSMHYITDPDHFLDNADYMMAVIMQAEEHSRSLRVGQAARAGDAEGMHAAGNGEHYLMLVLEDSGELLTADARERKGQALSRLLNLTEGFIGQGLNLLIMLTTNEALSTIHPAVARPGRCLQELEFPLFDTEQACEWLGVTDMNSPFAESMRAKGPMSLADLYALKE